MVSPCLLEVSVSYIQQPCGGKKTQRKYHIDDQVTSSENLEAMLNLPSKPGRWIASTMNPAISPMTTNIKSAKRFPPGNASSPITDQSDAHNNIPINIKVMTLVIMYRGGHVKPCLFLFGERWLVVMGLANCGSDRSSGSAIVHVGYFFSFFYEDNSNVRM